MFIWTLGDIIWIGVGIAVLIWFIYVAIYNAVSESTSHKKKPTQTQAKPFAPQKRPMTYYKMTQKKKADEEENDLLFGIHE